jgi:hypothetical protein
MTIVEQLGFVRFDQSENGHSLVDPDIAAIEQEPNLLLDIPTGRKS